MSEIGAVSHNYLTWADSLSEFNDWLLHVRKRRDGLIRNTLPIKIPEQVQVVLRNFIQTFDESANTSRSLIPLTIKQEFIKQIGNNIGSVSDRLAVIMSSPHILLSSGNDSDLGLLETIVVSLDNEVVSLYNRMRPNR